MQTSLIGLWALTNKHAKIILVLYLTVLRCQPAPVHDPSLVVVLCCCYWTCLPVLGYEAEVSPQSRE